MLLSNRCCYFLKASQIREKLRVVERVDRGSPSYWEVYDALLFVQQCWALQSNTESYCRLLSTKHYVSSLSHSTDLAAHELLQR